jgi:hypothetical protein
MRAPVRKFVCVHRATLQFNRKPLRKPPSYSFGVGMIEPAILLHQCLTCGCCVTAPCTIGGCEFLPHLEHKHVATGAGVLTIHGSAE